MVGFVNRETKKMHSQSQSMTPVVNGTVFERELK